ncbi:RNA polymerase sigma-70 factor [soil metagenome]
MYKETDIFSHLEEPELIDLIKKGNRKAFEEIYERYWFKLYKISIQRIKSTEDAKDLVQDLFISFWLKKEILEINTSFSSYLHTALKYKIINYIESNLVKSNYLSSLSKTFSNSEDHITEELYHKELQNILESGINNLSPKVKEVFELSRNEQMSISDIAKKYNVSQQTVKNQISKALKSLRVHVGNSSIILFIFSILIS